VEKASAKSAKAAEKNPDKEDGDKEEEAAAEKNDDTENKEAEKSIKTA